MEIDWGWNSMYHVVLENPHFELTLVECFNHTRQRALLFKKICQTWCKSQPWIITTAPFIEVLLFLFCMTGHHHGEWEEEGLLKETGMFLSQVYFCLQAQYFVSFIFKVESCRFMLQKPGISSGRHDPLDCEDWILVKELKYTSQALFALFCLKVVVYLGFQGRLENSFEIQWILQMVILHKGRFEYFPWYKCSHCKCNFVKFSLLLQFYPQVFFFLFFFLSTGGEEGEGAGLVVLDVTSQLNHGKVNIALNLALPNGIQSKSNA